jgi:outer membrane protein TolC
MVAVLATSMALGVSLQELVRVGLEKSTVVKKSKTQIELAKEKHKESKADQLGHIDLVGGYTHFSLPRTLAPLTPITMKDPVTAANVATTQNLFSTGVVYSVPLFTGFAQTRQVEMDDIAAQMSQSKLSLTKEQLVYNIASLYLSALALEEMYQAQKLYVQALRKLNKTIADEVKFGKKAPIDLLKSQAELQGNISYLEVLKGNIAITKASLASLVGVDHIGKLDSVGVAVRKPNANIDRLMESASRLNKVRIADMNLKKAQKGIEKSKASFYPQVALDTYYGYNYGPNDPTNPNNGDWDHAKNWQIGLSAKWTLYDFGKRDAASQRAQIAHMQAELDKHQTLLDLKKSLIEAREKLKQEYANYQGSTKQFQLAKESEKIEKVRYLNGVSTINDLLYAKSQAHIAHAKVIENKYNYQKGKYYLDYLLERGVKK